MLLVREPPARHPLAAPMDCDDLTRLSLISQPILPCRANVRSLRAFSAAGTSVIFQLGQYCAADWRLVVDPQAPSCLSSRPSQRLDRGKEVLRHSATDQVTDDLVV